MSARDKLHKLIRAGIGVAAGGAFVGMKEAGYVDGAETTVGVDAGRARDAVAALLAMLALWYPQLQKFKTFWRSLTNDDRVKELEAKLAKLEAQLAEFPKPKPPVI